MTFAFIAILEDQARIPITVDAADEFVAYDEAGIQATEKSGLTVLDLDYA